MTGPELSPILTSRRRTHPGVLLLEDVIKPLRLSSSQAADLFGISGSELDDLIHARIPLSLPTAQRIARVTATSVQSWTAMQDQFDSSN
jgi:addiction module HigA family antidote